MRRSRNNGYYVRNRGKDEDVVQWMHRYERIGRINRWLEDTLQDHFEMSLLRDRG
jgi:hypothetical protein